MRKYDLKPGFYHNLFLSTGARNGNTTASHLNSSYRTDYIGKEFDSFVVANLRKDTQDGESFSNKGFVTWRIITELNEPYYFEYFIQKEFNEFIDLKDRSLFGGSIRIPLHHQLDMIDPKKTRIFCGSGIMYEIETLESNIADQTQLIRSTNYISLTHKPKDNLTLHLTSYFQFNFSDIADYRILGNGSMHFHIDENIDFVIESVLRYDSQPPPTIKKLDFEITNGIKYHF